MLIPRIITAIVLLVVLGLALTVATPWGFPALAGVFIVVGTWEWMRLVGATGHTPLMLAGAVAVCLAALAMLWPMALQMRDAVLLAATIFWFALALRLVTKHSFLSVRERRSVHIVAGLLLGPACWIAIVVAYDQGLVFMVSVLTLVWVADIAAYFSGRAFGRHKLAPAISPNKTWEGVAGGVIAVWLLAALCMILPGLQDTFFARLAAAQPMAYVLIQLTILTGMSVVGDLFESHLKREARVKDSSALLPGHGGVLDRIDALLPVVPMALLLSAWL